MRRVVAGSDIVGMGVRGEIWGIGTEWREGLCKGRGGEVKAGEDIVNVVSFVNEGWGEGEGGEGGEG